MEPHLTSANSSVAARRDSLGLSTTLDLLEDVDFESTMMVLEQSERGNTSSSGMTPAASRRRVSSILRRGSMEPLDLSLTSLAELFPSNGDTDGLHFLTDEFVASALSQAAGLPSPSRRLSITSTSANNGNGNGNGADLKIRLPSRAGSIIKSEFPHSPVMLSPTMDSFLRDSWDDISDLATKTRRTSSKLLEGLLGSHSLLSPTGATPRRLSVKLPSAATLQQILPGAPSAISQRTTKSSAATLAAAASSATQQLKQPKPTAKSVRASPKQPRRAKQCVEDGCPRRAQSNNRCKTHGGGARCQMSGCDKSSQGGGLCRAHGGGKKCRVAGCTKGTQRLGLCYLHGGIRRCIQVGCKKKDRGNGYCISHGGGRRCEVTGCTRSVRKGNHCQTHQGLAEPEVASTLTGNESPFQISRGLQLHATS